MQPRSPTKFKTLSSACNSSSSSSSRRRPHRRPRHCLHAGARRPLRLARSCRRRAEWRPHTVCAGGRWWKVVKGIAHESPTEPSGKVYDGAVRCKYYGAGRAHVCACTYGAKKQQPCFDSLLRARLSTHGNCENAKRCGARQNPDPSHSSRTSFALAGLPGVGRSFELLFATFHVVQYLILVAAVVPGLGVQAACAHERWSLVLHACEQSPCHSLRSSTH